jgi:predicted lysophospholipase L1 biosynthesis ABC-type transport system permease subunit
MPSPSETVSYVAIGISALSLLVSVVNMVWNIYKERSLRARLKVRFGLSELHSATFDSPLATLIFPLPILAPAVSRSIQ